MPDRVANADFQPKFNPCNWLLAVTALYFLLFSTSMKVLRGHHGARSWLHYRAHEVWPPAGCWQARPSSLLPCA
eukprot:1154103-Pelagomonas_calceolata.AAC.1